MTTLAIPDNHVLPATPASSLSQVGQAANAAAGRVTFAEYTSRRAANTKRRQAAALDLFAAFLAQVTPDAPDGQDLATWPECWRGVTWGLAEAFKLWLVGQGYAVGTVNVYLSTVKTFSRLAFKAGALDAGEHARIAAVGGYSHREAVNLDAGRDVTRRPGSKKADPAPLDALALACLHDLPGTTPQERRDRVLVALLLDHGLRAGEAVRLVIGGVDLADGTLTFYRQKVDKTQVHALTPFALAALADYLAQDCQGYSGRLLRATRRGGSLDWKGMTTQAVYNRVRLLGQRVGVSLASHDLRHWWATLAAAGRTPVNALQRAGGWASPAMPLRYVQDGEIANEWVVLGK